jgi:uncharacterized protein (TIRG00374 family)
VSKSLKTAFQYLIIFTVTALLIWFSLRNLVVGEGDSESYEDKWNYLLITWQSANKGWLLVMAIFAVTSHLIRAERWRMLMEPSGYNTSLKNNFLSLMVGYLVNLVIPRGGEVSRCYNLYKLDKTPVEISFGTVVVERIVDLICLLVLLSISFIVESEKLLSFIDSLPLSSGKSRLNVILYILLVLAMVLALLVLFFKKHKKFNDFVLRTWKGFKGGLLSIFHLKKPSLFILYSIAIWFLYFLMSYAVILAFQATSHLGIAAVLSLFAIGSIAMAAPLPGGTGSYHVLVPQGLALLYHVPLPDAIAFTFIFHGWQTAIMIIGGAISLLVTSMIVKKKSSSS